jgi:DNA-binding CsgD family transcriptional regulator/N-acetylneuraminic acid mutarotase
MPNIGSNELSERELDILKLVATGAGNKEIAQKLFISSNTVKVHLRNIFSKIGVNSRTEAAMYAVRIGLVHGSTTQIATDNNNEIPAPIAEPDSHSAQVSVPDVETQTVRRKVPRWAPFILVFPIGILVWIGLILIRNSTPQITPTLPSTILQPTSTPIPHWRKLAPLPIARSDLALVAYENQIYALGGMTAQGVSGAVERYDPETDTWTSLSTKPLPVSDARAAIISGLIYVPGGRPRADSQNPTNVLEIYDPRLDQWHNGTPLPTPLSGYGLVAFEGRLYIFGGWDGQVYRDSVYVYDPSNGTWQEHTSMPTARAFCSAAEAAGLIYVIGGIKDNQPVNVNEIYSPSRDSGNDDPWETGFPLPESRLGIQAVTIADTIYVFGNSTENTDRFGLIYFPQTDTWQSLEASPYSLGTNFAMTSIGTNLFIVGGKIGSVFSYQNLAYQAIITLSIPIIIK